MTGETSDNDAVSDDDAVSENDAEWIEELARRAGAAVRTPAPDGGLAAVQRRHTRRRATTAIGTGAGALALIAGAVAFVGRNDTDERPAPPVATVPATTPATSTTATSTPATTTTSLPPSTGASGAVATRPTPSTTPVGPSRQPDRTFALVPTSADSAVVTPTEFVVSPDGSTLLARTKQTFIAVDVTTGAELRRFGGPDESQQHEPSQDGTRVFDGTTLWDVSTGEPVVQLPQDRILSPGTVRSAFSPDSTLIAVATSCANPSGCSTVYDATSGAERYTVEGTPDVFTPDSAQLLTNSGDTVVWDAATGARLRALELVGDTAARHVVVGDGTALLSVGAAAMYDVTTGRRLFTPPEVEVGWPSVTDDRGTLALSVLAPATGGDPAVVLRQAEVGVWDTRTGQLVSQLDSAFPGLITGPTFSPDGSLILAPFESGDGEPRFGLWSTATGQLVARLDGAHAQANARFSPDGTRVLAWGGFNEFWEWNVP